MATGVTLDLLKGYLDRFGWHKYKSVDEPMEKEGVIYTGWSSSPSADGFVMTIDPIVEKKCLSFHVPKIIEAPPEETPAEQLKELLLAMGFINYRIILGKFSFDPRDGEVRFPLSLPIDENTITYEQFEHCLAVAVKAVEDYAPKLRAIAKGEKAAADLISEEMAESGDLLRTLRRLLEEMERAHGGSGGGKKRDEDDPLTEV
jgi:hypothetical protein